MVELYGSYGPLSPVKVSLGCPMGMMVNMATWYSVVEGCSLSLEASHVQHRMSICVAEAGGRGRGGVASRF